MCQDHHTSSANTDRPGFKALLDVVRSGAVDAVVIADLDALSPDKVLQEIMISDIRANEVTVIATGEADLALLAEAAEDHTRLVVRDIVSRVRDYHAAFGVSDDSETLIRSATSSIPKPDIERETRDVVVELIVPTGSD
jgi:glycerate-2-kinase